MALASALWGFWWIRGPISEGRGWLDRARALGDSVPRAVQAEALFAAGALAVAQIDTQAAIPLLEKSVVLYSRLDDPLHLAVASLHLANALAVQEEGDRATALYADALRLFQELGDREGMAGVMSNLATARLIAGDREQARRLSEEALTICRDLSDLQGIAGALWNLGDVARLCGQWKRADCIYREMLSLYAALLDQEMLVIALEGFGHAMSELGWPDRAARLWGAAESLRTAIGLGWFDYQRTLYEEGLTTAHHQIDDETWRNLWEDGRAMTPEQAIAYALEERNPT